jgi:hypothetical protein
LFFGRKSLKLLLVWKRTALQEQSIKQDCLHTSSEVEVANDKNMLLLKYETLLSSISLLPCTWSQEGLLKGMHPALGSRSFWNLKSFK